MTLIDKSEFDRLAVRYDHGMSLLERLWLGGLRQRMLLRVRGRVLEVGIGTGANLPYYGSPVQLFALDESTDMLAVAAGRARSLHHQIFLCQADVEQLAFPTGFFDTIVASLVLCSVFEQDCALSEMRRVLSCPGGRLLLLEHMRPHSRLLAWLADILEVPWFALNGRCHLNRDTVETILAAGFRVLETETRLGGLLRLVVARPL